jgi:hypothetical protein
MNLFKFSRQGKKDMDAEGPWQRVLRLLIVALLFGAVVWGFWLNAERQQKLIHDKHQPAARELRRTP